MDAGRLFEEHHASLFRYLVRLTGDADHAADVAQEAFRRLLERPPERGRSRAWLFRVATNLVRERARTRTRRRELLDAAPGAVPVPAPEPRPDAAFEARRRQHAVRDALAALSEKERTILLMYAEGFMHREIAEAVDTTTKSVGTMIARALRKFEAAVSLGRETPT